MALRAVVFDVGAVHVRRGPSGHLHEPPPAALTSGSLAELPEALGV